VEIYEEKSEIHKEALCGKSESRKWWNRMKLKKRFVEKLDVDSGNTPIVDTSDRLPNDRI